MRWRYRTSGLAQPHAGAAASSPTDADQPYPLIFGQYYRDPIPVGPQYGCLRSRKAVTPIKSPVPSPLQEPGTGAWSCPRGPGFLMAPGHRASSAACWSPRAGRATRSLPAAPRGRDGLVRRLVDAEDLRQPGDLQDLQDPLLRADQVQRAVVSPHPLQPPDQHPEAGGVEEPDLVQVDDELVAARLTRPVSSSRSRGAVYISISPCTSMTSMPSVA